MALAFRDSDALQVVLRSGLCPPEVLARGAQVGRASDGALVLVPERPLPPAALAKLGAAGVVIDATIPRDVWQVRCWAEALAPVKATVGDLPSLVLFAVEKSEDLIDLAAELVRLGCDRIELLVEHGIARVVDPPTYTMVRALDHDRGLRVFAPDPAGQEAVWAEVGWRHPLAEQLTSEAQTLLLVGPEGWRTVPDGEWASLDAALELVVPGALEPLAPGKLPARRKISLRLAAGRREAPSLWVLRENAVAAVDKLLDYLPEDVVGRLVFAVSSTQPPLIVLRARTTRHPPPDLSLPAEEYAPLAQMPDVYAPANAIVEPPLRRERLRTIIGVGAGEVVWLARTDGGQFRVERTSDSAFAPLSEWADYVIHSHADALVPWMRAAELDFTPYVSTGLEWASERPAASEEDDDERKKKKRPTARTRGDTPPVEAPQHAPRPAPPPKPTALATAPETRVTPIAIDEQLAALESRFVALDAPGDAPERLELLAQLGHAYGRLRRRRDAGLCFARAVWESPPAEANARLDTWLAVDLDRGSADATVTHLLGQNDPHDDDVRLVAALSARTHAAIRRDPHRVHRWLDDHDSELDARTLWLSRLGLATLAGGDALGLAHARDRILARLAGGLPVERELPAFLRFGGRSGVLGNASGEHLSTALEELAQRIERTKRKRSPVEAPPAYTNAYVSFILAHGFARIGKHERAHAMAEAARQALRPVEADPVHSYLIAAFSQRVEQAVAGLAPETPLEDSLVARLTGLERGLRYKVDRLREASRILEPHERLDAIGSYTRRQTDSRGPEFAELRMIADLSKRAKAVERLVEVAAKNDQDRERLIDGIFDVLLELPEASAAPLLQRTWRLIESVPPRVLQDGKQEDPRGVLLAEALVVAGHFGRTELIPPLLESLSGAIRALTVKDLERALQQSLRALRRIGLHAEITELLAQAEHAMPQSGDIDALRARLALAGGLAVLGDSVRALAVFDQARARLNDTMKPLDRVELIRALSLGYAQAPLQNALGGIGELAQGLRDITDSFGTNSHYCLSVLHFVESLVLGITSDDLALGDAGRRFVEDDEHLIRRRLHRDLGGSS